MLDTPLNLAAILQDLLRIVQLSKDNFEQRARVLSNFLLVENAHLHFERLR
jgi:hypothetical protein